MANVQPGDLARVVAPYVVPGRGAFVTVKEVARTDEHVLCGVLYGASPVLAWVCDGWVRDVNGRLDGPQVEIGDRCLRRIDALGEDKAIETGVPEKVEA